LVSVSIFFLGIFAWFIFRNQFYKIRIPIKRISISGSWNSKHHTKVKKHFLLRLNPTRPGFAQDMSAEERNIMQEHILYWKDLMKQGIALVFGPVHDPKGVYGLGVIQAESEDQVRTLIANDPAITINKYEFYPMTAVTSSEKD
jgi:uncharacterized protein